MLLDYGEFNLFLTFGLFFFFFCYFLPFLSWFRTGDSRGFAFVRYKYADEAQKAVERLDGIPLSLNVYSYGKLCFLYHISSIW
jgi:hypothetical protein